MDIMWEIIHNVCLNTDMNVVGIIQHLDISDYKDVFVCSFGVSWSEEMVYVPESYL